MKLLARITALLFSAIWFSIRSTVQELNGGGPISPPANLFPHRPNTICQLNKQVVQSAVPTAFLPALFLE